ncbi:hypothetical protein B0H15DRAFT_437329 [Mycena belliarum]|uniref:Uncharacterized protein n=1 Tax=Mycena belliarum TaxID=1033014 RepID=A0AAD6U2T1_9AGAR|nr:hypothetical protein B0H15DRAFT_437329 [Mycena belliae]
MMLCVGANSVSSLYVVLCQGTNPFLHPLVYASGILSRGRANGPTNSLPLFSWSFTSSFPFPSFPLWSAAPPVSVHTSKARRRRAHATPSEGRRGCPLTCRTPEVVPPSRLLLGFSCSLRRACTSRAHHPCAHTLSDPLKGLRLLYCMLPPEAMHLTWPQVPLSFLWLPAAARAYIHSNVAVAISSQRVPPRFPSFLPSFLATPYLPRSTLSLTPGRRCAALRPYPFFLPITLAHLTLNHLTTFFLPLAAIGCPLRPS